MAISGFASIFSNTLRDPVLTMVSTGPNTARKADADLRLKLYHDRQADDLMALIATRWAEPERFRPVYVNLVRKIVTKKAMVYATAPIRTFEGWDQAKGDALYQSINANAVLQKATRYVKLCKTAALRVAWSDGAGRPALYVVTPNILDVEFGNDPENPVRYVVTHRGQTDAARRAEYKHHVAWLDVAAIDQTMVIGAIRHQQRSAGREIDAIGQGEQPPLFDHRLSRQPAIADHADHAITQVPAAYPLAQGNDFAGDFTTGGKRTRRLELVKVANDQRIGIVDRTGLDRHHNLPRTGDEIGAILQHQGFGTAGGVAEQGFHANSPGRMLIAGVPNDNGRPIWTPVWCQHLPGLKSLLIDHLRGWGTAR